MNLPKRRDPSARRIVSAIIGPLNKGEVTMKQHAALCGKVDKRLRFLDFETKSVIDPETGAIVEVKVDTRERKSRGFKRMGALFKAQKCQ